MHRYFRIFLVLMCFTISARSQNISMKFHQITTKDGLSQATINGIVQDKYGFIWIGTQDGLNRYDGYEFKVFKHETGKPKSISDSYILSLYTDSKDNIWIGTETGLNCYDFKTEQFICCIGSDYISKKYNHNNNVTVITQCLENPDFLWIGTNNGVKRFNAQSMQFDNYITPYFDTVHQRHKSITSIFEPAPGILWIGTTDGLFRIDTKKEIFKHFINDDGLSSNFINCIFEDSKQDIYVGTLNGLNLYIPKEERFIPYQHMRGDASSLSSSYINTIFEDSRQNLWIGTEGGGLNLFNRETQTFRHWNEQPGNQLTISDNSVTKIFEDRSGILWICTRENGVNKVNPNYENFGYFYHDANNPNSLPGNSIRSIFEDKNKQLWIGTFSGISIYNKQNDSYTNLVHEPGNPNSLSSSQIRVLYKDKDGYIWIGTRDAGLCRYNPVTKRFKHYKNEFNNPFSLSSNNIRAIYQDDEGYLWIGTVSGGMNRFDIKTETFRHYYFDENNPNSLNDNRVFSIIGGDSGVLWIGTGNGVAKFNPQTESFQRYLADTKQENHLSHHLIMGLTQDHLGNIWVASYGGGVNIISPETGKIRHFSEADGLSNNAVYGVVEDDNYNLWMSTNQGISKLDPQTEQFTNFGSEDGLQEGEFNAGAYYKGSDGEIYFGGLNGLNVFHPDQITRSKYIPPIVIHDFSLFNKSVGVSDTINGNCVLSKSILETDSIVLSYQENVFSFSFAALDFSLPEKNEYAYILENFETEWNYSGTRRYVTYTDLPAGEYTFRVLGSGSAGVWNEYGESVNIIIIPPWWKTKTFYILSVFLILLIIFMVIKLSLYRLKGDKTRLEKGVKDRTMEIQNKNLVLIENQRKLENQKQEIQRHMIALREVNATKDKFFSIIAHDLKSPFNTILGFTDLLDTNYNDYTDNERKQFLRELSKTSKNTLSLLENLLTWARAQRGQIKITKEILVIRNLVEESISSYIGAATLKNIQIDNSIPIEMQAGLDKETMKTAIGNLVSNGIKFTPPGGRVFITGQYTENMIKISVGDTGVGMNSNTINKLFRIEESFTTFGTNNEKGTGLGLILCKELIEKNGGEITVESEPSMGSIFNITIRNN